MSKWWLRYTSKYLKIQVPPGTSTPQVEKGEGVEEQKIGVLLTTFLQLLMATGSTTGTVEI